MEETRSALEYFKNVARDFETAATNLEQDEELLSSESFYNAAEADLVHDAMTAMLQALARIEHLMIRVSEKQGDIFAKMLNDLKEEAARLKAAIEACKEEARRKGAL